MTEYQKGVDTTPVSKHIATYAEIIAQQNGTYSTGRDTALRKSSRPDTIASFGGDVEPPSMEKVERLGKEATPVVRMGRGVDHSKVVAQDWKDYNLWMQRNRMWP